MGSASCLLQALGELFFVELESGVFAVDEVDDMVYPCRRCMALGAEEASVGHAEEHVALSDEQFGAGSRR